MQRRAFALIETLVVIGIIGAIATLTIPLYREYQIRSDLDNATQQATHGLARAKLLSQLGQGDSSWGFYVPAGILYKGTDYATRDTARDEVYPMPSTIAVSGLLDVSFSRVKGAPSTTGSIVLRALNNDQRIIQVTIAVSAQQLATNQSDVITICLNGQTMTIVDAEWPTRQAQGAVVGACASASSAAASSAAGASSSHAAVSSATGTSSAAGGGGGGGGGGTDISTCASKFSLTATNDLTMKAASSVVFTNLLSQITFGAGGPSVPVHVCYSKDNGSNFLALFAGNGNCEGNGNAYGNAVQPNGTDTKTVSLANADTLVVRVNGQYKQQGWLAFNGTFDSNDKTGQIIYLKNGDHLADYPGFGNQASLKSYLASKGYANSSGTITISSCQLLAVTELGTLGGASADFQDDVLMMQFN